MQDNRRRNQNRQRLLGLLGLQFLVAALVPSIAFALPNLAGKPISAFDEDEPPPAASAPVFPPKTSQAKQEGSLQRVALIVTNDGFSPHVINLVRENPVEISITSTSPNPLCFISDDFGIRRQVTRGKILKVQLTPTKSGIYRFYCPVNKGEGTLVVTENTSSPTVETAKLLDILREEMKKKGRRLASNGEPITDAELTEQEADAILRRETRGIDLPVSLQVGASYMSYWQFWSGGSAYQPASANLDFQTGVTLWNFVTPYFVLNKGLDPASQTFYLGGGVRVIITDPVQKAGIAGSVISGAKLYVAGDFVKFVEAPPLPAPQSFLSSETAIRFGAGVRWSLGTKGTFYVDTSVMAFRPSPGWYVNPLVAIGVQL